MMRKTFSNVDSTLSRLSFMNISLSFKDEDNAFFQKLLHSLQMVFVGIVDRLVDLTSHTYFAKLLQVVFYRYVIITFFVVSS